MNTPSTDVSPGLGGFLAFFVLAVVLWLLMRNMNTRLRRLSYREEQEAKARRAASAAAGGSALRDTERSTSDRSETDLDVTNRGTTDRGDTSRTVGRNSTERSGGAPDERDTPNPGDVDPR